MNRYERYQDTGHEWIGEMPEQWQLSRVGKFFSERSEKVDDITYPPLSVTMSGIVDQLSDVAKTNDGENRKLVKKDDFVINSRSDRKGSSGIAPRDGSVSLINIVLEPKKIDPQFIQHLFKSYYFKEEFFRNGKGIHWDLWTTRWDQFKNINIPIPSIQEQKLISRYLDKKTNQIDSLIEKIQKKVELLKEQKNFLINHSITKGLDPNLEMKESGVEWIGNIPKNWDITKIKNVSLILNGFAFNSEDFNVDYDIPVIRIGDIKSPFELDSCMKVKKEFFIKYKNFQVLKDDILVGMTGGTIGKSSSYESEKPALLNQRVCIFRSKKNFSQKFLALVVSSDLFKKQVEINCEGGGQPNIGRDELMNFTLFAPSLEEQLKIVSILTNKLNKLTSLIHKEQKRLSLLVEYRQSLISSVVTGKVRLKDYML